MNVWAIIKQIYFHVQNLHWLHFWQLMETIWLLFIPTSGHTDQQYGRSQYLPRSTKVSVWAIQSETGYSLLLMMAIMVACLLDWFQQQVPTYLGRQVGRQVVWSLSPRKVNSKKKTNAGARGCTMTLEKNCKIAILNKLAIGLTEFDTDLNALYACLTEFDTG